MRSFRVSVAVCVASAMPAGPAAPGGARPGRAC